MSALAILKLLKTAKDVHDYVKKENNLDQQMGSVRARLSALEKMAHPRRKFVVCEECNHKIKEKKK